MSPIELIQYAIKNDIGTIAITDHDSVEGIKEIIDKKDNQHFSKIRIIAGIEISAKFSGGTLHILGYGIDIHNQQLLTNLSNFQNIRKNRNANIVKKLVELGIELTIEELENDTLENKSQGRPHIARLLIKKKAVKDIDEAFDIYLGRDKKAFVSKEVFSATEAISMIHKAGGLTVLAHPATLNLHGELFEDFLDKLISYGLDGIEVFAPLHSEQQTLDYLALAKEKNILVTGGSDFHGDIKPNIRIGECSLGKRLNIESISQKIIERNI